MRGKDLFSIFGQNLANAIIHNSFSQEQSDAFTRQRAMSVAATLLDAESQFTSVESGTTPEIAMIPAALQGLHYHRLRDWKNAAYWYKAAAQEKPFPQVQQNILISPWMELTSTGNFILRGNVEGWQIQSDSALEAKLLKTHDETLFVSCAEIQESTKSVILAWKDNFAIPYHHTLVLRTKVKMGTTLILEIVIDGQLIRHLTQEGTGKWQDSEIPVEGNLVQYIYVHIREDANALAPSCQAEIDSISFLLDETAGNDRS